MKTKKQKPRKISNNEVFELLGKANEQYNKYLELRDIGAIEPFCDSRKYFKRNMSHPLGLALR
jgi:hypothetical protein